MTPSLGLPVQLLQPRLGGVSDLLPSVFRRFNAVPNRIAEIRSDAHGDYDVTLTTGKVLRMTRSFSASLLSRV